MTTKHKPGPVLCKVMKRLLREADEHQGTPVKHTCTNNLRIDLRIIGGIAVLLISRSSVYPSETEWRTVLRHMPFEIDIPYSTIIRAGRHWFRGRWVLQKEMDLAEKHKTGLHTDRTKSQPAEVYPS